MRSLKQTLLCVLILSLLVLLGALSSRELIGRTVVFLGADLFWCYREYLLAFCALAFLPLCFCALCLALRRQGHGSRALWGVCAIGATAVMATGLLASLAVAFTAGGGQVFRLQDSGVREVILLTTSGMTSSCEVFVRDRVADHWRRDWIGNLVADGPFLIRRSRQGHRFALFPASEGEVPVLGLMLDLELRDVVVAADALPNLASLRSEFGDDVLLKYPEAE
jgi:hypothetical protein